MFTYFSRTFKNDNEEYCFSSINQQHDNYNDVSDSNSLENASSTWLIKSVVVVARPWCEKAWAAQARDRRDAAHPAIIPIKKIHIGWSAQVQFNLDHWLWNCYLS